MVVLISLASSTSSRFALITVNTTWNQVYTYQYYSLEKCSETQHNYLKKLTELTSRECLTVPIICHSTVVYIATVVDIRMFIVYCFRG